VQESGAIGLVLADQAKDSDKASESGETLQESQQENGISEFNLTFGPEAETSETDSESELIWHSDDGGLKGREIMMDLPNHIQGKEYHHTSQQNGVTYNGELDREGDVTAPRRVSLDGLNSAEQDGFVVTNAVVIIG
jgi:hypothetical protein